jgi:anti-sigma factor RsiW
VATLASEHPVDVVSTVSHTVKPWFSGKVPFSVDMPNLSGTQFELVGGIFGVRKHHISVFMMRDGGDLAKLGNDSAPVRRAGLTTQTWVEDGVRYFAISDVNAEDVRKLCDLLKQSS